MYIIESTDTALKFITGIFNNNEECYDYYFQLDADKFQVKKIALNFPFYIVENNNKFEYYSSSITKIDEGTIYYIDKKYIPSVLGNDEMGQLDHTHFESMP